MATINGTNRGETLRGTAQDDRIDGRQGDDTIHGGTGNDALFGGVGRDLLFGDEGDDVLDGGNGNDELTGGAGNDRILGGNAGDVARFSGDSSDYRVEAGPLPGTYIVTDLRSGSPDGTDTLDGVSLAGFADGLFDPEDLISQTPPNQAPVANADAAQVGEEGGQIVVLGNDTDPDGDALTIVSLDTTGAAGTASINPNGTVSYTPAAGAQALQAGQTMTDSFTYTVRDAANNMSTATVTVTVVGAADAPEAADDALTLAEDSGAVDVTGQLIGNDGDVDAGDSLKVSAVQAVSAQGGTVTVSPDGQVTYDPGAAFAYLEEGETATDTFSYTVTDSTGLTSTATATVTITGVGSPEPDAYFYVQEDGTNDEMLGAIIESFGFEVVGVETEGTLGTVLFDLEDGILSFTADHDSSDVLNFDAVQWTYFTVIGDEGERKVIGMVIEGNNDEIVAVDDAVAIGEGQISANLWSTLIANEVDPDGSPNTREILSVDTAGTQGSVAFDASSRTLTYSAAGLDLAPGETITDSFTYEVEDGFGSTDTATVTVTITGAADGSVGVAMAASWSSQAQPPFGEADMSAFLAGGEQAAGSFGPESLMPAAADPTAGFEWQIF